jgi:WD40 repeat protein/predicted Ser/Thr protein kinase
MQPTVSPHCPKCGAELASPGAECANCLLELGFGSIGSNEAEPASEKPSAARVFGDYELLDEIARGGMGVVYRARQRRLGRTVAVKLIAGGRLATREFVRRFRAEAAAAAALQHPNIVAIHDVGVHEGSHFFSMDYVEGQNLAQLVGNRPLPAQKAAHYLKLIAEAIHYAHEQGILHRDLKPSNVLVDAGTDQPRVTDFGLAKWLDKESSLTLTGQVLGSPHFMPPEQADARRGKVDRRSDVFGLGGILYFLLTARPPFQGNSLETTLGQVLNVEPVSPRLLNPAVPRDLETICLKCLSKEPDRRYPTAQALGEDLSRFLNAESILARPTTILERTWRWCRRRPAFAGLLAAAIALLLTLAIGSPIVALRIQHARQIAEANLYGADLNLAQTALADADLGHARELLDRHRPAPGRSDPRGLEWRYLWNLCQGDEKFVFEPVIKWPRGVAFSQDGRLLAAGEESGNLSVVWNLATKAIVKTLPQGDRPVTFALDGPGLITAGRNGLKLWNTQTWKERVLGPCHMAAAAVFSPNGSSLIVYGAGLQMWDTQNWTLVSSNDFGEINWFATHTLSVSHDGALISCGRGLPYATAGELRLFRLPSLEPVPWSERLPKDVVAAAFHPERDLLVTGGWSGDIQLWDSNSGQELPSIMKQPSRILAMSFSPPESNLLATTGGDQSIRLWDLASQRERVRLHGALEDLTELAFSPDGQMIATGGPERTPITLWDAAQTKAEIIAVPVKPRNCVLGFSEDGRQLMTIDATGRVMYRDPTSLAVSRSSRVESGHSVPGG